MGKVKTQTKNSSVKSKLRKNPILFNRKGETRVFLFLSFVIPFVIIWFFFAQNEVHPFGGKQILVTDLWHQYYPFFRVEHEKLHSLSSFLYSWKAGLGTNFISLMSYYAASPLNILAVFFPIEYSRDALTLFLTMKIAFAGLFFAIFLKHIFNKNDFSITAFAVCYALCDYIMGYYWNIIWIDTVALLPLVVLGTVKLYKEGKYKLYVISLALSLTTSFYIGLFTCIFTVMVFAAMVVIEWAGFKNAFKRLGQITGATLIGAGLGAVILIPAFLGLMLTNSANNQFPTSVTYYEPWLKMVSSVIGFHEPTAKEGLPNFYCGMFAVVLLGAFLRSGKIKFREKFITAAYLIFIVISCNMNVLNYMWHGFHFTNMLPYRFSFLLSFILLAAGYRAFTVMKEEGKILDIAAMAAMTVVISLVSYNNQEKKAVVTSVIVCLIFTAAMILYKLNILNKTWLNFTVCLVCVVEMGTNAKIGVETVTVTDYVNYPRKSQEITEIINELEANDTSFFRMETTNHYSINDPALYGYRGISQFSSTANVNVTSFMHELGIDASEAGNRYYYNQNTAVFNTFMNLKYIISTDKYSGDLTYLDAKAENNGIDVFENNHYLPLGFTASNSLLNYSGGFYNQFENQNELFKRASGINKNVFKRLEIKDVGHKNLNVSKTGYGNYNFQYNPGEDSSKCFLKYNYNVTEDGPVYAVFKFSDISSVRVKSGDSIIHTQSNVDKYMKIFAAGEFKAGDVVTFQADVEKDKGGSGNIYVYQLDREVFEEGYQKLAAGGGLQITDYDDTHINGTIKADRDCLMYTSIPYDGGWRAYVDGKKTEVKSVKNALVCVPLTAGEHEIRLRYYPPGFIPGLIITITAIALFVLLWIFEPKIIAVIEERKKARIAQTELLKQEEAEVSEEAETTEKMQQSCEEKEKTESEAQEGNVTAKPPEDSGTEKLSGRKDE